MPPPAPLSAAALYLWFQYSHSASVDTEREGGQKLIKWVIKRRQNRRGQKRRKRKIIKGFYLKEELTGEIRFELPK